MPGFDALIAYDFVSALGTNFLVKERAEVLRGRVRGSSNSQQNDMERISPARV